MLVLFFVFFLVGFFQQEMRTLKSRLLALFVDSGSVEKVAIGGPFRKVGKRSDGKVRVLEFSLPPTHDAGHK